MSSRRGGRPRAERAALVALGALVAALGVVALGMTAVACGGPAPATSPARPADAGASTTDGGPSSDTMADSYASVEVLAARGPSEAPLMRELLRVDRAAPRSPDLRAERDTCFRAVFAAPQPVRAWFADAAGAARGEVTTSASGAVPPRGPVCATKGEVFHLVVEAGDGAGTGATARAVIFAAP